ncbi:curli assembly protein CsgF [bacterium]|jgi:hypothetical protein|nr:curli assembly protein CsgF [bacterium]|tara:strand:- start:4266 stop:4754 length:489 start_codon:yes stop_codon:yes gene_type:complete
MKLILPLSFLVLIFSMSVHADKLTHKFKNPSFSGIGTGAHYLTVENQEKSRRDKIKDDIESALKAAEREENNSTINKFIRNLESRIYSQISKGLVDSMFCDPATVVTCTGSTSGAFDIEGNAVSYEIITVDGVQSIVLTIVDADGSITTVTIPIGIGNISGG